MNKNLCRKNYETRDEFYTTKETAENLYVNIDPKHFVGKFVYCNCDGPESEIYRYWKTRYAEFGLAKLVATKYNKDGNGIKTEFDGKNETVTNLAGNGSYDSEECLAILQQCDIVTTNPPFSLLSDYIPMMCDSGKDIILIINMMCLFYKKILPYTLKGKFRISSRYEGGGIFKHNQGELARVQVIGISTISCTENRIWKKYTVEQLKQKNKYIFADDGILEFKYLRDLPVDYYDEMYVPTSILLSEMLQKYYDIIGMAKNNVTVNGKTRFKRIVIKRNNKEIKD